MSEDNNIIFSDDKNPSSFIENTESRTEETSCQHCTTVVASTETYCHKCGFPVKGTEHQQKRFLIDKELKEIYKDENTGFDNDKVNTAQNIIFALAFLNVIGSIYYYVVTESPFVLMLSLFISLVYAILGFWAKQKPLPAILCCLVLYITLIILNGLFDPTTLLRGIIIKIIIIVYLIKGIKASNEAVK